MTDQNITTESIERIIVEESEIPPPTASLQLEVGGEVELATPPYMNTRAKAKEKSEPKASINQLITVNVSLPLPTQLLPDVSETLLPEERREEDLVISDVTGSGENSLAATEETFHTPESSKRSGGDCSGA